jgi:diguanylate cyclase (GGDEF)-like protein
VLVKVQALMMPPFNHVFWGFALSVLAAVVILAGVYRLSGRGTPMRKRNRLIRERLKVLEIRNRTLEQANKKLQRLSYEDGLTGLANRRHFDEAFELELRRARRIGVPLSLIMIDVDGFKAVNDSHGHQFGDECLMSLARALRDMLNRPGDLIARYGGEEFVVLLPETTAEGAGELAEAIRARVEGMRMSFEGGRCNSVMTVSLGVVTHCPTRGVSPAPVIAAADEALYWAKQEGRNRVVVYRRSVTELEKPAAVRPTSRGRLIGHSRESSRLG